MENKHKPTLQIGLLLFFTSILNLSGKAQEITLELVGNRQIESGYRISKQPQLIDTVIPYSEVQYPLLSLKYDHSFKLDTIRAARIKLLEELPDLYPAYVRVGIGSKFMPLAEFHYGSTRSRKWVYDASFKHLSSLSDLPDYASSRFDRSKLMLSGQMNERKYSLSGGLNFDSRGLHHYGFKNPAAPRDSIAQRFTGFGFDVNYHKHRKDSLSLNYDLGLAYDYFQDKTPESSPKADWNSRENNLQIKGRAWYRLGKELINADLLLKYNSFKYGKHGDTLLSALDSGYTINNLQTILSPNITTFAQNHRLKIRIGVQVALDVTDNLIQPKSKVYLYPDVELKYSLFNDILIPYLQVGGGLEQQRFRNLSQSNEFILSNIQLASGNKVFEGRLGIKGTLSSKMTFNVSGMFNLIKNKALFVTDTLYARNNRFRVVYDQVSEAALTGGITYEHNKHFRMEALGIFHSYFCENNIFAWNLPQLETDIRAMYSFDFPLCIQLTSHLEGGRYALVYQESESDYKENEQFAQKLGFITDFNLMAEYRYNKRLSAFIEVNNLATQRYKRWYNYPVQGLQVLGGISFRF